MNAGDVFLFVFFALIWVVIGTVFLLRRSAKKSRAESRRAEARELASELKFSFYARPPRDLHAKLSDFKLFKNGNIPLKSWDNYSIANVISNTTDSYCYSIFDYRFETGGENSYEISQSVVFWESKLLNIPDFQLFPEGVIDLLFGAVLGDDDIDFGNHPLFSQNIYLRGINESEIRRFFDQGMLDFFYSFTQQQGIAVEGAPGKFIYYIQEHMAEISDTKEMIEEAFSVYSAFIHRTARPTPIVIN